MRFKKQGQGTDVVFGQSYAHVFFNGKRWLLYLGKAEGSVLIRHGREVWG